MNTLSSHTCVNDSIGCTQEGGNSVGAMHTLPDTAKLFFKVVHLSLQVRKLRPRERTVTCSEPLRDWRALLAAAHCLSGNFHFLIFISLQIPATTRAGVIRADLGETHYQRCPGGLGIWKCFGEEMGKKLTLASSPGGSKVQSGGP